METEENNREEKDRNFDMKSLRVESAGMGQNRVKSFSVIGMGSWSTRANSGLGKNLFGGKDKSKSQLNQTQEISAGLS